MEVLGERTQYSHYHNDRPLQPFCVYGEFGTIGESEGCRILPGSKSRFAVCRKSFRGADEH